MQLFIRIAEGISEATGRAVSALSVLLVAVVCFDVFTRYALNRSTVAAQELQWHLFSVLFLLATAYTLKHDKHVRVDIFYNGLSEKGRAWIDLLGVLLFLTPFCVFILIGSWNYVANSFAIQETSPDPGGLPYRYLLKACIPLAYALLLLQGWAMAAKSAAKIIPSRGERA